MSQIRNQLPAHLQPPPLSLHSPSAVRRRRHGQLPLRRVRRYGRLLRRLRSLHHPRTFNLLAVVLLQGFVRMICIKITSPKGMLTLSLVAYQTAKSQVSGCQCRPCVDQRARIRKRENGSLLRPKLSKLYVACGHFVEIGFVERFSQSHLCRCRLGSPCLPGHAGFFDNAGVQNLRPIRNPGHQEGGRPGCESLSGQSVSHTSLSIRVSRRRRSSHGTRDSL